MWLNRLERIVDRRSLEIELVRQPIRSVRGCFVCAKAMFFGRGGKNLGTLWNSAWRARINPPERRASARRPDRAGPAIDIYVYRGEEIARNEFVSLPGHRRAARERTNESPRREAHDYPRARKGSPSLVVKGHSPATSRLWFTRLACWYHRVSLYRARRLSPWSQSRDGTLRNSSALSMRSRDPVKISLILFGSDA